MITYSCVQCNICCQVGHRNYFVWHAMAIMFVCKVLAYNVMQYILLFFPYLTHHVYTTVAVIQSILSNWYTIPIQWNLIYWLQPAAYVKMAMPHEFARNEKLSIVQSHFTQWLSVHDMNLMIACSLVGNVLETRNQFQNAHYIAVQSAEFGLIWASEAHLFFLHLRRKCTVRSTWTTN